MCSSICKLLDEALARGAVQPVSTPAPSPTATAWGRHSRDSDITTVEPAGRYAYALYDRDDRNETLMINGGRADVATAKQLHADDASPMFWLRRDDQAWLIRDRGYVDRARAAYAPVTAYERDAGKLKGEQASLEGQMEGLRARQRSIDDQRLDLRADPQAPAAAQRLASLDAQQRGIASQKAGLERQQGALKSQREALERRKQQVLAQAEQNASRLVDEARGKGLAQEARRR